MRGASFALATVACFSPLMATSARAEEPAPSLPASRWVLEPRAFLGGALVLGDARELYGAAPDVGVGIAVGRPGARLRWRASLDLQPALDVGPGASITLLRTNLGAAFTWRQHLVTALEAGPIFRRIAIDDEISRTTVGASLVGEVGWRIRPWARWSLTASGRASTAWFYGDLLFLWKDVAAFVTLERETTP
ncbi:MAG: hypothetical protein JWM82_359 [Myxococcales bacterium]|nr:hypothetical protein [Myxococcales bacterium]